MQDGDDGALSRAAESATLLPAWSASVSVDKVLLFDISVDYS